MMKWITGWMVCTFAAAALAAPAPRAREAGSAEGEADFSAERLLKKAEELMALEEGDRARKMIETILKQYPASRVRYRAQLALGRSYMADRDYPKTVEALADLKSLGAGDPGELTGQDRETYLEGMYLTGVAQFEMRQYAAAFPILRGVTRRFPNTIWANQAYYYIGMCHFAQENWSKAITALSFVGTFVDPDGPTVQYVEAGRRFYVKITDGDLLIAYRMGEQISVTIATDGGDREPVECIPLMDNEGVYIGSISTEIGPAKVGDGELQVVGGDEITTTYDDRVTDSGDKNVARQAVTKVVSTATLRFTMGTYDAIVAAAFLGQPLFLVLHDVDLDTSAKAETVKVKVVSRFRREIDEEASALEAIEGEGEQDVWQVRDEVTVPLSELGEAPVRTGRFAGTIALAGAREGEVADRSDDVLRCALDDEIVATCLDTRHIGGEGPRQVEARLKVAGELNSSPRATQNVVSDPLLRAKKNLVEAQAYLELARIFKSMGLLKGAKEKASEGLDRIDELVRSRDLMDESIRQEAYRTKWELHLSADEFGAAIATCQLFNRLYPDSPLVDEALMGIARIHLEHKDYPAAKRVLQQVLRLPKSQAKAEAQFLIAQATEAESEKGAEAAVREYRLCAQKYPESMYAGKALSKVVDYYVVTKDYAQANELLSQVFQDYPDASFLDSMLLKWAMVAYYRGEYDKAFDKCRQLVFDYPSSQFAETAKKLMAKIQPRLEQP